MYVRLQASYKDKDEDIEGIFWVAKYMYRHDKLYTKGNYYDHDRTWELLHWFGQNLPVPRRFDRSRKKYAEWHGLSWFKDSSVEHLRNLRELAAIIKKYGASVEFVKTDKPGYIVYEDELQVVAEPYRHKTIH